MCVIMNESIQIPHLEQECVEDVLILLVVAVAIIELIQALFNIKKQ